MSTARLHDAQPTLYRHPPRAECYTCPSLIRSKVSGLYKCGIYNRITCVRVTKQNLCVSWGMKFKVCTECEMIVDIAHTTFYRGQCGSCSTIDHRMKMLDASLDIIALTQRKGHKL